MGDGVRSAVSDLACWAVMGVFAFGFAALAVKLHAVQVDSAAEMKRAGKEQSVRRIRTTGGRGRILDRNGTVLAGNRESFSIVCHCERFQQSSWKRTVEEVMAAASAVAAAIGLEQPLDEEAVMNHLRYELSVPLVVWDDIGRDGFERFAEHSRKFPGFSVEAGEERVYPHGRTASHVLGYVGSVREQDPAVGRFYHIEKELRGKAGLEYFYDGYLRGVYGEKELVVDSRCFKVSEETLAEAGRGVDLVLSLDLGVQEAVEKELETERGACVVLDPRDGAVIAAASSPAWDPNRLVPRLTDEMNERYVRNRLYRNRFSGETYAPGSTFKPVTAVAALANGRPAGESYCCTGVYAMGDFRLHCSRRWGHGDADVKRALMVSCNPFFCNLGVAMGTNALVRAARAFGLGAQTGADIPAEVAGIVPTGEWKQRVCGERWYPGDLAQMSIGQGMLLVTPLQMARVAGAIATGELVRPRFSQALPVEKTPLPFAAKDLAIVREGMRLVVNGRDNDGSRGSGWRAGEDVVDSKGKKVLVCGKTGTAEVGSGARRRKNTWFIAYAPMEKPSVAVAMVIENGESGGGTTAPKVARVLRRVFGAARD